MTNPLDLIRRLADFLACPDDRIPYGQECVCDRCKLGRTLAAQARAFLDGADEVALPRQEWSTGAHLDRTTVIVRTEIMLPRGAREPANVTIIVRQKAC